MKAMKNYFVLKLPQIVIKTYPQLTQVFHDKWKNFSRVGDTDSIYEYFKPLYSIIYAALDVLLIGGPLWAFLAYCVDADTGVHVGPFDLSDLSGQAGILTRKTLEGRGMP